MYAETTSPPTPSAVQSLLDTEGCARLLCVSPAMVERLRLKAGLPAIDLSLKRPGRRPKHLWRYDPVEVRAWWQRRTHSLLTPSQADSEQRDPCQPWTVRQ